MVRVKVVNEASDLVGLLSAVDTPVKRDVFLALTSGWESERTIESRFGANGRQALSLFDKQELLDSRWESSPEGPHKLFHTRYSSFRIDTTAPMLELTEVFAVAMMPAGVFEETEDALVRVATPGGVNIIDASAKLSLTQTVIRTIVKRSGRLELKGLRVVPTGK